MKKKVHSAAFARLPWSCDKRDQNGLVRVTDKNGLELLVCEATVAAFIVECANAQMPEHCVVA